MQKMTLKHLFYTMTTLQILITPQATASQNIFTRRTTAEGYPQNYSPFNHHPKKDNIYSEKRRSLQQNLLRLTLSDNPEDQQHVVSFLKHVQRLRDAEESSQTELPVSDLDLRFRFLPDLDTNPGLYENDEFATDYSVDFTRGGVDGLSEKGLGVNMMDDEADEPPRMRPVQVDGFPPLDWKALTLYGFSVGNKSGEATLAGEQVPVETGSRPPPRRNRCPSSLSKAPPPFFRGRHKKDRRVNMRNKNSSLPSMYLIGGAMGR